MCGTLELRAMSDHVERVRGHFADSARLKQDAAATMAEPIARAGALLTACLLADGRILACGNGGSAADAQHFAAELVGRFERERPELPAISLATDTSLLTADRQRLRFRAGVREAGARTRQERRRAARYLDVRQLTQRDLRGSPRPTSGRCTSSR